MEYTLEQLITFKSCKKENTNEILYYSVNCLGIKNSF